ncbi:MAG: BrnT family toxin [Bryobacteraceae bacterium]
MDYEWDPIKAAANLKKHGVAFMGAATVFLDRLAITYPDPDHSVDERREITIGHTMGQQLVFVSHCERGDRIRIISARLATKPERRQYEEAAGKESGWRLT